MLNLLIADDNKDFDISILNSIRENNLDNIKIQGIATDGADAYQKIKIFKPDLVLLDIQMPVLNGLQVINKLISENFPLPKIIITTGYPELLANFSNKFVISGVLLKPFDIKKLSMCLTEFNSEEQERIIRNKIINILSKFEFNCKTLGYRYLIDCIQIGLESPELLKNFDKNLYPYVAKFNHTLNISKIKWNIEKCIRSMLRFTDTKILEQFFSTPKPSPRFLIIQVIEIIKKDN